MVQELDIPNMIKSLRKERGLSQKDLAMLSNVSVAVISRIENGDLQVNARSLDGILRVFGYCLGGVRPKGGSAKYEEDIYDNEL
ncbi:MAG: helix-turn-helix transcriptional regulator [Bacteriovoracaceae bacterium]|jgi:transcriptional regulator with XRE-family HTH domain|nr:helix-turn-helix transcriptional regulator [Bacteriovoracaceae bacterium]|tara:strand:- start:76 stop:327 length:252 start_codon:yes stop_codon:yes gene_type:complete